MSEFDHNLEIEIGTEKNFGLVFSAVFAIIALYPLLGGGALRVWAIIISVVFLIVTFVAPSLLKLPNKLWHKFGLLLGAIIAPVAMGVVYFLTIAPIGILLRLSGKDLLRQKPDPNADSYWIEREEPVGTMKNQF
ncbi:MAG: SxtJ family membrane protein [Thermodesulfobacteriota bacterium]